MSDPAAIRATFADWRTVKGRKQLQIILEVPLERQGDVLKYLGAPNAVDPKWVAIALLDDAKPAPEPVKERRRLSDMPLSQQIGMRCDELGFKQFIKERSGGTYDHTKDQEATAKAVRHWCSVKSRADIKPGTAAEIAWKELDDAYFGWSRGYAWTQSDI